MKEGWMHVKVMRRYSNGSIPASEQRFGAGLVWNAPVQI